MKCGSGIAVNAEDTGNEHRHVRGFQFLNIQEYVRSDSGDEGVRRVNDKCGVEGEFDPKTFYPDDLFTKMLISAEEVCGVDPEELEFEIGLKAVPWLKKLFPAEFGHGTPEEFIENFPNTYQRLANSTNPFISFVKKGPSSCSIYYYSSSKLCGLVRGIISGSFENYGVDLSIKRKKCQKHGDDECVFDIHWHARS